MKFRAYFFLAFSIVSFTLAIFIFNYDLPKIGFTPGEKYQKELISRFEQETKEIESFVEEFSQEFFRHTLSENFNKQKSNGRKIYVYQDNNPIFWTDYHIQITQEIIKSSKKWFVLAQKEGKLLIHKKQVIFQGKLFQFISVVPLRYEYQIDNKYLIAHFNQDLFDGENQQIHLKPKEELSNFIYKGNYLFSLKIDESARQSYYILVVWVVLLVIGFISLLVATILWVRFFENRQQTWIASLVLLAFLLLVRLGMLMSDFPFRYVSVDFFNPKFFAASILYPSFGDLFLNTLSVFIMMTYIFRSFGEYSILYTFSRLSNVKATLIAILLIVFTNGLLWYLYYLLDSIYRHSQWNFDITTSIQINYFKLTYALIFIMFISIYFMVSHLILLLLSRLRPLLKVPLTYYILGVGILLLTITLFIEGGTFFLYFLNVVYLVLALDFKLYKGLRNFHYESYLYLFLLCFIGAVMGAYTIAHFSSEQEQVYKQRMATELLTHHDFQGEYLLSKVGNQIQEDLFIQDKFLASFTYVSQQTKRAWVRQKIKRVYLNNYFDKYDINISIFDANGRGNYDNKLMGNYNRLYDTYNQENYATEYTNLFFVNDLKEHFLSRYVQFIELKKDNQVIGHIILNLTLRKFRENSVYPKLLENRRKHNAFAKKLYSYAILNKNRNVVFSTGEINYENAPHNKVRFLDVKTKTQTQEIEDYNHLIVKGEDNQIVVISSPNTSIWKVFTNFSYFFLMLLLALFVIILVVNLYWKFQNKAFSFSSKIQMYLNIAYFLPLALVSVATLGLIKNSYEEDLKLSYQEKANKIKNHLSSLVEQRNQKQIHYAWFRTNVLQLSKYANVDINLYSPTGKLMLSSQPLLFESHLLSNQLNPEAMKNLVIQHNNQALLEEKIGEFNYNAVYARLSSPETGKLLGVLSIPFFNSREALDKKKIDVISTVLNIFVVIFFIIVILSYVSFRSLTTPLQLITTKLKKTSFNDKNEPIEWKVKDEIGILVHEYNAMLMKLEESKRALSKSEKESAWREMAQQVAHEIKNPLTPMKLKLQHLQYTLGDSEQEERLKNSMGALLKQVETLNDIATSFSSFAKMPIPENIPFNITETLHNIVRLYEVNHEMTLKVSIFEENIWVNGDEKLFGRILTNLILNGKQAVASDKEPIIELVSTIQKEKELLIEVKDNGDGIPEEIQHKVFLPNFSTKYTGSGIGLAVAKRGIAHAGGKIWFETKTGEGTSFFIVLPII
ncbi:MAG: HAMP domain-containing histidine kinase [Cytophagales bacterium]|nr:HAMP domain-containing histidine kinase [Cytophagales bacterium]